MRAYDLTVTGSLTVSGSTTLTGDITYDDLTATGNIITTGANKVISGSVTSTGSFGRAEVSILNGTTLYGTVGTAAQNSITSATSLASVSTVTTGVWNSTFGSTSNTIISGSFTAVRNLTIDKAPTMPRDKIRLVLIVMITNEVTKEIITSEILKLCVYNTPLNVLL